MPPHPHHEPHHEPPHDGPHHQPPAPKPHWSRLDQMPDEEVLRFAPPEIRRLWRKLAQVEAGLTAVHQQNEKILAALQRLERPEAPKS